MLAIRAKVNNVDYGGPQSQPVAQRGALCPAPGSGGRKAGGYLHAGLGGPSESSGTWGRQCGPSQYPDDGEEGQIEEGTDRYLSFSSSPRVLGLPEVQQVAEEAVGGASISLLTYRHQEEAMAQEGHVGSRHVREVKGHKEHLHHSLVGVK